MTIVNEYPGILKELTDIATGYQESILLLTANNLDLFTFIGDRALTSVEIAVGIRCDARATEIFLNALTAIGLITKMKKRYANSLVATRFLIKGMPSYQGDILNHHLNLWKRWSRAREVLKSGEPLPRPRGGRSPQELRNFINGMANLASLNASPMWQLIELNHRKKLLDIGGGPGTYSLTACEQNKNLKAIVFDFEEVKPIFEEHRSISGAGSRVSFRAGDALTDKFPTGCDVVLLSNMIHSWGEQQNRTVIAKLDKAIKPGGLLLIKDFFISEDGTEPSFSALFAVNMLLGTPAGRSYSRKEVESWFEGTKFTSTGMIDLTERSSILMAEK